MAITKSTAITSFDKSNQPTMVSKIDPPYYSPISPALYPQLAILLSFIGVVFLSWFFIYEVTSGSIRKRNSVKEATLALLASLFLGFGTLFLLLWTGVYV